MKCLSLSLLLFCLSSSGDEFGRSQRSLPHTTPAKVSDLSRYINRPSEDIVAKYACKNLSSDPETRAQQLIEKFSQGRDLESRRYQVLCWSTAEQTAKDLTGKNDELAQTLRNRKAFSERAVNLQIAIEKCGGESAFSKMMVQKLAEAQPFDDLFRTIPIKIDGASPTDIRNSLRDAIYSENLTLAMDNSIRLAKSYGLGTSNLLEKICPTGSVCESPSQPRARNLKAFLGQEIYSKELKNIPQKNLLEVANNLQGALQSINDEGKAFNSQLACHNVRSLSSNIRLCNTKLSDEKQAALNANYYARVNQITSTLDGNLLDHEPFKTEYRGIYATSLVERLGGGLLYNQKNAKPGWDSVNGKTNWDELTSDMKLTGGVEKIKEAAQSTLDSTIKYTNELNRIEDAVRKGKDPGYGILSSGDPAENALVLMARLNPTGAARVLLANPGLAKTDILCGMARASEQMEKDKDTEALLQNTLGWGSLALGVGSALLPGGQIATPGLVAAGAGVLAGVASGGVGVARGVADYKEAGRSDSAYSATGDKKFRDEASRSRQAGNSAMTGAALAIGGSAAQGLTVAKGFKAALAAREASAAEEAIQQGILEKAAEASKRGNLALDGLNDLEIEGAVLGMLKDPKDIADFNRLAQSDPAKFKVYLDRLRKACSSHAGADSAFPIYALIFPFVSEVAHAGGVCNWDELKTITAQMRASAAEVKLRPPTVTESAIMKDPNYSILQEITPQELAALKKTNPAEYERLRLLNSKISSNTSAGRDAITASKTSPIPPEVRAKALSNEVEMDLVNGGRLDSIKVDRYRWAAAYASETGNDKLARLYLGRHAELTETLIAKGKPLTSSLGEKSLNDIAMAYAKAGRTEDLVRVVNVNGYTDEKLVKTLIEEGNRFFGKPMTPIQQAEARRLLESARDAAQAYYDKTGWNGWASYARSAKSTLSSLGAP